MQRALLFKFIFPLVILISSPYCEASECNVISNILTCSITNVTYVFNTLSHSLNTYNSTSIIYSGQVILSIISASTKPIFIQPVDTTNGHTIQVLSIDTNTSRIEIKISLSSNPITPPLFTTNSRITAPNSTISVTVAENYIDSTAFQIFNSSNSSMFNFANYEIIFNQIAFQNLTQLTSLTLIEPQLNSSCLKAITPNYGLNNLLLGLGSYAKSDFDYWISDLPRVQTLTINNISTLDIFASKFFNKLQRISQVKLTGGFQLEKKHICIFYRMNIQIPSTLPIVYLNNGQEAAENDPCANIYIKAINQRTTNNVQCPQANTCDDCRQWAKQAASCDLISYENNCAGDTSVVVNGNPFMYNGSYLYYFFQNISCATSPTPIGTSDSVNIGAIVGAVCGLLIALMILGITVFCVYRSRQRNSTKSLSPLREEKYKSSSSDSTHVSIATSKSSKSSRYVLEKSFFPPIQSNDEIAPPLYTAPSESVGYLSNYRKSPVPSAPRASVSTHTTHLYETVYN
ncbi:unnamed protein product [Rotaria magnacalcarata]|uniref:Uncharacterized protein n=1 Tax=Rotaria magnacalcarata TaxID=392030 RepID=A0A8S2J4N3_9BILA|nr:unnamed protein product [Rotaria magnacalcarata]